MARIPGFEGESLVTIQERNMLLRYARNASTFLEIGSADGVTVGWLAQQCPECYFLSIDLYKLSTRTTPQRILNWRKNSQPNQNLFVGTAEDFLLLRPKEKFHLAFIDGSHMEHWVTRDIQSAKQLTFKSSTILFHDYGSSPKDQWTRGVTIAVDKWLATDRWVAIEQIGKLLACQRSK